VCARCEAVRYCSRECQRTDWKAHKPVCTAQTNVSADCVVHAVVQETSLTSSNTESVDSQSNTPLSAYDTKPGSTDAPPEDDTQIMAALHMNVTFMSKKWVFIGICSCAHRTSSCWHRGASCCEFSRSSSSQYPFRLLIIPSHCLVLDSPPCQCRSASLPVPSRLMLVCPVASLVKPLSVLPVESQRASGILVLDDSHRDGRSKSHPRPYALVPVLVLRPSKAGTGTCDGTGQHCSAQVPQYY
jgi:hypothetical protein